MPDEAIGRPSFDGDEPEDRDHGAADEAAASVVFDDDFIRAATIHEPTAAEREHAARRTREQADAAAREEALRDAEAERYGGYGADRLDEDGPYEDVYGPYEDSAYADWARDRAARYRGPMRWHRPVAWLLAVVMGIGVIAMAFAALQRGGSGQREEPVRPPATSEPDDWLGAPVTGPVLVPAAPAPSTTPGPSGA